MNKKRKHHYVWEHYLGAWATDEQLWCQRGTSRFLTSTENVAQRRDFYRLKELNDHDLAIIEELVIKRTAPLLQDLARGWIPMFRDLHKMRRAYEQTGRRDAEFEEEMDRHINDLEEDWHAKIEGNAIPILAALRNGNASVLGDAVKFVDFVNFIAAQYMRTPRTANAAAEALAGLTKSHGFNVEAGMGLMRTIWSTNIAAALMARQQTFKITFLEAAGRDEFIASDQPIINVRAVDLPAGTMPTELEFYYPLSPSLAALMYFDHRQAETERKALTGDQVRAYNGKLAALAEEQFFASTEAGLDALDPPRWR